MTEQDQAGITPKAAPAAAPAAAHHAFPAISEKLAHRALSDNRKRPNHAATWSIEACDRLYARMFPIALCQENDGQDPAPDRSA